MDPEPSLEATYVSIDDLMDGLASHRALLLHTSSLTDLLGGPATNQVKHAATDLAGIEVIVKAVAPSARSALRRELRIYVEAQPSLHYLLRTYHIIRPDPITLTRAQIQARRGITVLAFDGGLVRVYAALVILDVLMNKINALSTPHESFPRRPHEVFDLICGSGTGGVVALFLGRLQMSVPDAMNAFEQFARATYGSETSLFGFSCYSSVGVTRSMDDIVEKCSNVMRGNILQQTGLDSESCHTFVTTTSADDDIPLTAYRLRSYPSLDPPPAPRGHRWTISQAAHACTAGIVDEKPLRLPNSGYTYEAADNYGFNNPAQIALEEISRIQHFKERSLDVLLSLGSGSNLHGDMKRLQADPSFNVWHVLNPVSSFASIYARLSSILNRLPRVATDSSRIEYATRLKLEAECPGCYFRLDAGDTLNKIEAVDTSAFPTLQSVAWTYAQRCQQDFDRCANKLVKTFLLHLFLPY